MEKQYRIGKCAARRYFYPTRLNESHMYDSFTLYYNETQIDHLTNRSEEDILLMLKLMNRVDEEIHRTDPKI